MTEPRQDFNAVDDHAGMYGMGDHTGDADHGLKGECTAAHSAPWRREAGRKGPLQIPPECLSHAPPYWAVLCVCGGGTRPLLQTESK